MVEGLPETHTIKTIERSPKVNENVASYEAVNGSNALAAGLKQRHITMISIAGVIGTGLFVGSGHAIATAGPAVMVSFL